MSKKLIGWKFIATDLTDAEILQTLGGKVGSKLIGDEGRGPEVIQITAVGEKRLLAKLIHNTKGEKVVFDENNWTLKYRDWALLEA